MKNTFGNLIKVTGAILQKKTSVALVSLFMAFNLFSQSPQKISFQAVVRDATGKLVALKPIGMRISILQGSEVGAPVFAETQTPNTNVNALLTISIGSGTPVTGSLSAVNWAAGPYFLKTEIDPAGGTNYSITGTQQLMSVPYALYTAKSGRSIFSDTSGYSIIAGKAGVADSLNETSMIALAQLKQTGASTNDLIRWNGSKWAPSAETKLTAGNGIKITGGVIGTQWSNGLSGPYTDSLRVGIGTNLPVSRLHVSGQFGDVIRSNFEGYGWNSFWRYGKYLGYVGVYNDSNSLDFGTSGQGTDVNIVTNAKPRMTIKGTSGYVGIGTVNPISTLDVNGSITSNFKGYDYNTFYRNGILVGLIGIKNDTSSLDIGTLKSGTDVNIVTQGLPKLTVTNAGNVGIGATTPGAKLEVNGKTKTTDIQITNGAGAGKVLTSDASGNASWTTSTVGKQIVGVYALNGYAGTGYSSMSTYSFMGPTTTITITSTGDIITGSAMAPIGAASVIAGANFGLGYQLQPSGTIINFTGGNFSNITIGTERDSKAAAATVTGLAAGTYKVGVIVLNTSATVINNTDYINGYFMLIR